MIQKHQSIMMFSPVVGMIGVKIFPCNLCKMSFDYFVFFVGSIFLFVCFFV